MQWTPYVTVAAVIERDERFLMVEEAIEGRVVFNQPAGHLERDESLVEAARREVLEETAWHFRPEAVVGLYLYAPHASERSYLRVCFCGSCEDHRPERGLDKEILRAPWLSREELLAQRERLRTPMVLRCIDDYRAGHAFPLDLLKDALAERLGTPGSLT